LSQVICDDLSGATLLQVDSPKHGTFVIWIDSDDAERVSKHTWSVVMRKNQVYFLTNVQKPDGKRSTLKLHRFLKTCPDGEEVDHEKHEYLDLRKTELRCVNDSQNRMNQRKVSTRHTSSRFKGVSWFKKNSKWMARIKHNSRRHFLGYFPPTPEGELEAALAYDRKAIELFGEFSHLNFPLEVAA
jgi:AP2 domain